ncbi:TonB-dependent receptor [Massilia pinisoli]|uniref:TonB-dependent receptor n=1 Tax=Massilia pinisoli TaxID=1772194 RepID=A0ABT1ZWN5_9BURK|nr:TonB-dependent receptor [Massilia pinisoli]MCS0584343.1 TonB-dependent receptor [Massilia pinisoli]
MKQFQRTAIAVGVTQLAVAAGGVACVQGARAQEAKPNIATVVVVGQRAALESAAARKKSADEIVDSVVEVDIGKLPDKSVTEVLQRVVGVTIDRTMNVADPLQSVHDGINHFAAEGTGVSVRGLSYVRSELNGRDAFSANGGRSLSFEDVPPELMAGVDVYKNPSAEQIEGGIGGLVNLRTHLPFDFKGRNGAVSIEESRSQLRGKYAPSFSGLLSNRWKTGFGEFGALIDIARSRIDTRSDGLQISPYIPRTDAVTGDTSGARRWISNGGSWTTNNFERERDGLYGALQWKKDTLSSYLTYFRSKYDMHTSEHSLAAGANPATIMLDPGATFNDQGALLAGTIRAPQDPGVGFGVQSRTAGRTSDTRDVAWNLQWRATDRWTLTGDLQHTRATTFGYDNLVSLGGYMPKEGVDFRTSPPTLTFDAADRAYLADPNNYYWNSAQEHRDDAVSTQNAARLDAKYTFDGPVLNDVRFGVRFTNRDADTRATHGNSQWHEITAPWAVGHDGWQPFSQLAYLSDPRFAGDKVAPLQFNDFFGGKTAPPPAIVAANMALSAGAPPPGFAQLHEMVKVLCNMPCSGDALWEYAKFGDPESLNQQHEKTKAAYAQLRFGFDDLRYPVDGNVGVRVVRTDMSAAGYLLFSPPDSSKVPGVPSIAPLSNRTSFEHKYTNVLPSLNLRMKASDGLQFRAAFSKGMTRPDFWQMQTYTTLSQNVHTHTDNATNATVLDSIDYTGTAVGNPMLKPTRSNNIDLTAEYYFGHGGQVTLALFNKRLSDIIIGKTSVVTLNDSTGQPHDFAVTSPVNGATGRASGAEIGYSQYFDKLPGLWSGFGVSANYTYIDSRQDLGKPLAQVWCTPQDTNAFIARDLSGCDTDGRLLNVGSVPLTGLSKNAFNVALLYDKGPVSARLAYGWRSKYLQAVNAYGTNGGDGIDANPASPRFGQPYSVQYALPTWGGAYGQLDASLQYKFTDNLNLSVQATNLTNALYKQYMQQGIGLMERGAFYTGRRYSVRLGYSF